MSRYELISMSGVSAIWDTQKEAIFGRPFLTKPIEQVQKLVSRLNEADKYWEERGITLEDIAESSWLDNVKWSR